MLIALLICEPGSVVCTGRMLEQTLPNFNDLSILKQVGREVARTQQKVLWEKN
jgi:hypothetical protein